MIGSLKKEHGQTVELLQQKLDLVKKQHKKASDDYNQAITLNLSLTEQLSSANDFQTQLQLDLERFLNFPLNNRNKLPNIMKLRTQKELFSREEAIKQLQLQMKEEVENEKKKASQAHNFNDTRIPHFNSYNLPPWDYKFNVLLFSFFSHTLFILTILHRQSERK